ncbi:MAG: hypothetical protein J7L12_01730 [Desulfurococcales archaeon]|nr:hypothetical protein [Desulfurococcales archaeon]
MHSTSQSILSKESSQYIKVCYLIVMMTAEECISALRTFANALAAYLRVNARRTLAISSLTGQKNVKIALRALARFHNPSLGYSLLSEAITELISKGTSWMNSLGWKIILRENEVHLILPLSFIRNFLNASEDEIFEYLLKSGVCREDK